MTYTRPDHYTKKAKAQGYAARSVFKLAELDERTHAVPQRGKAIDLGCFPGSWSRWLIERGLHVVGVDLKAPELAGGQWIVGSVLEVEPALLVEKSGGKVDILVSDMAPSTTGSRFTDHCRQIELARRALFYCDACLEPGGSFVVKVFDGEDAPTYQKEVEVRFKKVRRIKPDATRDRSVEFFLVATGFRGTA